MIRRFVLSRPLSTLSRSWWGHVEAGPKDPILGVTEAFIADPSPDKVNVGVGAYRDDDGKPVVLKCVQTAQRRILDQHLNNEYAPIGGIPSFVKHAVDMTFGTNSEVVSQGLVTAVQALSGTGALRVGAAFISRFKPMDVYLPNPTWGNHIPIFNDSGLKVHKYRYYDPATRRLDFNGLLDDVQKAPNGSCFLLHACAHNPTGVDPTSEQWKEISRAMKKKEHFVFFDNAYQGFASGDPARDASAINQFVKDGHQVMVAQSFAKSFGLYGHRVGCLSMLVDSPEQAARVESQLKILIRPMYSSPPIHGARIVSIILEDSRLRAQWFEEVKQMADRMKSMRHLLVRSLADLGSKRDWSHITDQIGMFCFSGLTPEQVALMTKEHHIYLTSNGRISIAGMTSKNTPLIAKAIHDVTK